MKRQCTRCCQPFVTPVGLRKVRCVLRGRLSSITCVIVHCLPLLWQRFMSARDKRDDASLEHDSVRSTQTPMLAHILASSSNCGMPRREAAIARQMVRAEETKSVCCKLNCARRAYCQGSGVSVMTVCDGLTPPSIHNAWGRRQSDSQDRVRVRSGSDSRQGVMVRKKGRFADLDNEQSEILGYFIQTKLSARSINRVDLTLYNTKLL